MNLGRYRLIEQLGAGSDGLSFRAEAGQAGQACEARDLSAARADPERWKQVTKQLLLTALLQHPAHRKVLELNLDHEPPYVIIEAAGAPRFAEVRADDLPWPAPQVLNLAAELAGALQEAHKLGLVHGNLRPSTITWQPGHGIKLDFTGLSCQNVPSGRLDASCVAPELLAGRAPDAAADVFALGAILTWLLRGQPPLAGISLVSDLPSDGEKTPFLTLLEGLLAVDPNERPSAQILLDQLNARHAHTDALQGEKDSAGNGEGDGEVTRLSLSPLPTPMREAEEKAGLRRLGRFRLLELIGEGGLGKVFRAEDVADGAQAAIKVLHPHLAARPAVVQRFRKEARLLAEVKSPFVANLLEINEDQGVHYLALEYIAGSSLNRILKDPALCPKGFFEESHALVLMLDVARALADAHRRGIIHRDIKPQNIMVLRDSWLLRHLHEPATGEDALGMLPRGSGTKLCDFGLARHVIESDSLHLTQEGVPLGTPLYMSPEQALGLADLGPTTDVYALGATLYHVLAGRPPFMADSALALGLLHTKEPPPPLTQFNPRVSDGVCRIVSKALAKKPHDRYPDAGAFLDDLERLLRGEPSHIEVHPKLPQGERVLQYDWSWDLEAAPEQLWPYVSNTERLNRAIGMPGVAYNTEVRKQDGDLAPVVHRFGKFRKAGVINAWQEHPFEWVEGKRLGVLREYSQGVLKWLASTTELVPRAGGGCTVRQQIRVEPRSFLGRLIAGLEVGFKVRRRLEQVYRRIDAYVRGRLSGADHLDPFETPATLSRGQRRRLQEHLQQLLDKRIPAAVVERLGDFLEHGPEQEVARLRPLALARRLQVNADALVAACLHGARQGLLVLLWDILCPLCRIPSGIVETLKALKEHGHCEACNADFPLDFAQSVEMIFRVHPDIRSCETKTYCIGGPSHSPHVVAQVRVAAGERFDLDLALGEGTYRVRGPQLPRAFEFRVEEGAYLSRWSLEVPRDFLRPLEGMAATAAEGTKLRPGAQHLVLKNEHSQELLLRIERTAARADALTAARVLASGLFRELFPGEILESGKLVNVAAVTLLVLDLNQATSLEVAGNLYEALGEARTFGLLHDYFQQVDDAVRREGGAIIKTLGETILVAFENKAAAVRTGLILGQGLAHELGQRWPSLAGPLQIRAGLHHGPAMSATVNNTLDYFGTTVDQALRLPTVVPGNHLVLTRPLATDLQVVELFRAARLKLEVVNANLPGGVGVLLAARLK